jgi:hypothetical protein
MKNPFRRLVSCRLNYFFFDETNSDLSNDLELN